MFFMEANRGDKPCAANFSTFRCPTHEISLTSTQKQAQPHVRFATPQRSYPTPPERLTNARDGVGPKVVPPASASGGSFEGSWPRGGGRGKTEC